MKLNHAIKKIAAVGTAGLVLGMSAAAVSAFDLSDYPAPFIQDGEANVNFVVGSEASTADMLGVVDIATSLQASAVTEVSVGDGASGSQTVIEDGVRLQSGSDNLYYGVPLSDVKTRLTEDDADLLSDVEFEDEDGETYDAEFQITPPSAAVTYGAGVNDLDDPTFFVDFSGGETWEFEILFPETINVSEFRGETVEILGTEYTFGQGSEVSQANQIVTLFKSGVDLTIEAGSPETVMIGDQEVDISVIGANTDDSTATIVVNGESETVSEGEYVTVGGQRLFIDDVFIVNIPTEMASVRVFVGAQKIILEDGQPAVVEVDGDEEDVDGTTVTFGGDASSTSRITVLYTPNNHDEEESPVLNSDDEGLLIGSEYVDPVFNAIAWSFTDVVPEPDAASRETIRLYPSAEDEFSFEASNFNGAEYDIVVLRSEGADSALEYGDGANEDYVLAGNAEGGTHTELAEDNRFILRSGTDSEFTRVLEVANIDFDDEMIELTDVAAGGETREFSAANTFADAPDYDADNTTAENLPFGVLTYDGFDYGFVMLEDSNSIMLVDASNAATGYAVSNVFVTENGATLAWPTFAPTTGNSVTFNLTEETNFNDADVAGSEASIVNVEVSVEDDRDDHEIWVSDVNYVSNNWSTMVGFDSPEDLSAGITEFGTYIERDAADNAEDATVYYLGEQTYYNVFAAAEGAEAVTSAGEGDAVSQVVNPINVGAAILDSEAASLVGEANLIVVGGPCVNTVAADLMGNPADCAAGFERGSGLLKLFDNEDGETTSLLVAGYDADDTRLAAQVLANYEDYQGQLVGDEVVVSGTRLTDVVINAPTVTEDDAEAESEETTEEENATEE